MESNKQVVLRVLKGAFVERDATVEDRYFSADYVQHNPTIPNGPSDRQSYSDLKGVTSPTRSAWSSRRAIS